MDHATFDLNGFRFSVMGFDEYLWAFSVCFSNKLINIDPLVSINMGTIAVAHLREIGHPKTQEMIMRKKCFASLLCFTV